MKSLTNKEYEMLSRNLETFPRRERVIFCLFLFGGLRVGELVGLNVDDVIHGQAIVSTLAVRNGHGNNGQIRYIPLNDQTRKAIAAWLEERGIGPAKFAGTEPLIISAKQKIRIQSRDVQRIVARYARSCLRRPVNPHMLRHTFATRLMKVVNIRVVQQLLGHRSLNSTQVYTHPSNEDCEAAISAAFQV